MYVVFWSYFFPSLWSPLVQSLFCFFFSFLLIFFLPSSSFFSFSTFTFLPERLLQGFISSGHSWSFVSKFQR